MKSTFGNPDIAMIKRSTPHKASSSTSIVFANLAQKPQPMQKLILKKAITKKSSDAFLPSIEPLSTRSRSGKESAFKMNSFRESLPSSPFSMSPRSPLAIKKKKRHDSDASFLDRHGDEMLLHLKNLEKKTILTDCLQKHNITADLRARMVDWISEVLRILKNHESTIFLAVVLLDRYFSKVSAALSNKDLHILSIASMTLASKFISIDGISLQTANNAVGHNRFTKEEIMDREIDLFKVLNFQLDSATPYDFILFFASNIVMKTAVRKNVIKTAVFLAGVNMFDYELCGVLPSLQAVGCLYLAFKINEAYQHLSLDCDSMLDRLSDVSDYSPEKIVKIAILTEINARLFNQKYPECTFFMKMNNDLLRQIAEEKELYIYIK